MSCGRICFSGPPSGSCDDATEIFPSCGGERRGAAAPVLINVFRALRLNRRMIFLRSGLFLLCALISSMIHASDGSLESARTIMQRLQCGSFDEVAGQFRFPDTYTAVEIEKDKSAISASLQSLVRMVGRMTISPDPESGIFAGLRFSIRSGDAGHALPSADPEASAAYRFRAPSEQYADAAITVVLDDVKGAWTIHELAFVLPATDPTSLARMRKLAEHMIGERLNRKKLDPEADESLSR